MIEASHLVKKYGANMALDDVCVKAEKGRVLGLLGQNGAGKTTLLSILTGYLAPTSGSVSLDGFDPLLEPMRARRLLGYMPEHPPLYDEMTVQEYLRFAALLKGVRSGASEAHIREVMEITGLSDMQSRKLGNLSKGYRQRASMAQALCGDPETLLLDEPTSGLDPKQITEIRELIRSLAHDHTIVFSSHMLPEVQQLCDDVVILHRGKVRLFAPLADIGENGGVTLLCTLGAPAKKLEPALRQLECLASLSLQDHGEETIATLTFNGVAQPERQLFSLCSARGLPILSLQRSGGSLEQVFLNAISD